MLRHPDVLTPVGSVLAAGAPKTVTYISPVPVERVFEADISPFRPRDGVGPGDPTAHAD